MNIAAVILAAGLSRRMGQNKLLLPFRGGSLLGRTLRLTAALPFSQRILVTSEQVQTALQQGDELSPDFQIVLNHAAEQGQSVSLRLGTAAAIGDGYLFFTGDQPLLDATVVLSVLEHAAPNRIVVPRALGRPGNPVFFGAYFRDALLDCRGDRGGRGVRDAYPHCCIYVDVPDARCLADIDTPEQYAALLQTEAEQA